MRTTVGAAARLTVEEGDKVSPRFRPYHPFAGVGLAPPAADRAPAAVGQRETGTAAHGPRPAVYEAIGADPDSEPLDVG